MRLNSSNGLMRIKTKEKSSRKECSTFPHFVHGNGWMNVKKPLYGFQVKKGMDVKNVCKVEVRKKTQFKIIQSIMKMIAKLQNMNKFTNTTPCLYIRGVCKLTL